MKKTIVVLYLCLLVSACLGQNAQTSSTDFPRLIRFSGILKASPGKAQADTVGVTFALYHDAEGGSPIWLETQNVTVDAGGHYSVMLGSASKDGMPAELFVANEARWLGVREEGQEESTRLLLVSVPYALKAADAETLGGMPLSAFLLNPGSVETSQTGSSPTITKTDTAKRFAATIGVNYVPVFADALGTLTNSLLFQSAAGVIGINTATPSSAANVRLHVNGNILLNGQTTHQVQMIGAASSGRLGQDSSGFFFASDTTGKSIRFLTVPSGGTLTPQMYILGNGNVGVGTATPGNKLTVAGTVESTSGGVKFPDASVQTTAGIAQAAADARYSRLGSSNTFVGNQSVTGSVSVSNTLTASSSASQTAGVTGANTATGVNAVGVMGISASPTGTAGVFNNTGGGKVLSAQTNGFEFFNLNGDKTVNLIATGTATSGTPFNSTPLNIFSSAFNSSSSQVENQVFTLYGVPQANNTANPNAKLSVVFGSTSIPPTEKMSVDGSGNVIAAGTVASAAGGFVFPDMTMQTTAAISQAAADARYLKLTGGTLTGALTAPSFTGSGAGLTGLKTTSLSGLISPLNLPGSTLGPSLQQIATLNWRGAAPTPQNFPAGNTPEAVAFDGTNIWVTNKGDNNVMKLRPSDGAILGTYNVGTQPYGVTFDGTNMWVANFGSNNVTKLSLAGATLGTFNVGTNPIRICYDGTNLWVTNYGSGNVTKLSTAGATLGTFTVGTQPYGVVFDGTNIWVSNDASSSNSITVLKASDGSVVNTYTAPYMINPEDMAFDGANVWVTSFGSNALAKFRASDGAFLGYVNAGYSTSSIAFDGSNMWVVSFLVGGGINKVRSEDGRVVGTQPTGNYPNSVAFDGSNVWTANYGSNSVTKIPLAGVAGDLTTVAAGDGSNLANLGGNGASFTNINANQLVGTTYQTYSTGAGARGLAWDGTNIWVALFDADKVQKFRMSDGALLDTISLPKGTAPYALAYDGANIWATNRGSAASPGNSVTKIRVSDDSVLGTFSVGSSPLGITFDGTNIWVANFLGNTVSKLDPATGGTVGTYNTGTGPAFLQSDGTNMWVTITGSTDVNALPSTPGGVLKLKASDGTNLGTVNTGRGTYRIAFDSANIWVDNAGENTVTEIRASDSTVLGTYTVGNFPVALAFDGSNIWVANDELSGVSGTVMKLGVDGSKQLVLSANGPALPIEAIRGMIYAGGNIWVSSYSYNTITRISSSNVGTALSTLAQGNGSGLTNVAHLTSNNSFAGNQTVQGNVTASGSVTSASVSAGTETLTGTLTGTSATFSGNVTAGSLNAGSAAVTGSLSATSAGFNGNVNGYTVSISNSASGTQGGALSVSATQSTAGAAAALVSQGYYWGVWGSGGNAGVYGSSSNYGVWGSTAGSPGYGVFGNSNDGTAVGVEGDSTSSYGVHGVSGSSIGVFGESNNVSMLGHNTSAPSGNYAYISSNCCAADLYGPVSIHGTLSKPSGSFKIDHPLDPENKYLYHSFVESPDMKNIYDGVVTTDANGYAVITLPDWFMALNKDFRYQLTVIGVFAQAIVDQEITDNHFRIRTNQPSVKVSWQVTGIRHDPYAVAHPIPIEENKSAMERGTYSYPEVYGQPPEKSVRLALHPEERKAAK